MRPRIRRAVVRLAEVASGLGLAAAVALPRLVPLERIRTHALTAAEAALHRPVEAGDVRLEIFSGLGAGVENLAVRNGPGWESPALFSAQRVSLKLAFLAAAAAPRSRRAGSSSTSRRWPSSATSAASRTWTTSLSRRGEPARRALRRPSPAGSRSPCGPSPSASRPSRSGMAASSSWTGSPRRAERSASPWTT
jgi:hypothetical protein